MLRILLYYLENVHTASSETCSRQLTTNTIIKSKAIKTQANNVSNKPKEGRGLRDGGYLRPIGGCRAEMSSEPETSQVTAWQLSYTCSYKLAWLNAAGNAVRIQQEKPKRSITVQSLCGRPSSSKETPHQKKHPSALCQDKEEKQHSHEADVREPCFLVRSFGSLRTGGSWTGERRGTWAASLP